MGSGVLNDQALLTETDYGYDTALRLLTVSQPTSVNAQNPSATYYYLANSSLPYQLVLKNSASTRMTTKRTYDYINRIGDILSTDASGRVISAFT